MYVRLLLAASLLCLAACGRAETGGAGGGSGGGSGNADGGDTLDADERGLYDHGSDTSVSSQTSLQLADSLFEFDPTIDPTKTAAQNAAAIQTQAKLQLGTCGTVSLSGTTVTVAFGAAPGCTLVNGTVASGSATLAVSASGSTTTIAMTFTSLVVNGKDLNGNLSFATTTGTTFAVTGSLTSSMNTATFDLTVTGTATAMTIDGTSSAMKSGATASTTLTFTAVKLIHKDCYPSSGSIKLSKGLLNETLTFLSTTPTTGQAQLKVGLKTSTVTLPAYGKCPP
jgi:hypothetical protein